MALGMTAGREAVSDEKDWCTPPEIVASVRCVFNGSIDLDPCSNPYSVVGATVEYALPRHDGLRESWDYRHIFVNPPYGSDQARGTRIAHWFARIAAASANGSELIALVPVATNTGHWKKHVYPVARAICFLYSPRLRFYIDGHMDPKGAPMACAAVYYGPNPEAFAAEFCQHGAVVSLDSIVLPKKPYEELTLFDAAGPEREVDILNPKPQSEVSA